MFGYLKSRPKLRLAADPRDPNYGDFVFKENDWSHLYPDAEEYIDDDVPDPLCPELRSTAYVDCSHANDYLTRRSHACVVIVLGQMPVRWYSKLLNTVETSTYGAELVTCRVAMEHILSVRYKLQMLGVQVSHPAAVLCDNQSVVHNLQLPSSALKKKHHACAYHKCREAIALGVAWCAKIDTNSNIADMGTKPLGPHKMYTLSKHALYGRFD